MWKSIEHHFDKIVVMPLQFLSSNALPNTFFEKQSIVAINYNFAVPLSSMRPL
jgi:hypothetical protein